MIRFLAFGDLHYDEMSDGDERIDELLCHIRENQSDFCISLGDCCHPLDKNKAVLKKLEAAEIPVYFTIGNHETSHCHLEDVLEFYSLQNPYYSFTYGEYKFIVMNSCYFRHHHLEIPYDGGNYKENGAIYPLIPAAEMEWLKKELEDGKKHIIFSHHSLANDFRGRGVSNREEVRNLFHDKKVILCMNGHDHGDGLSFIDNIPFYTVNSASYVWLGEQIMNSEALKRRYGYLNGKLPYKQALCVLVEIDETEIRIKGIEGEYQSVTPDDIELYDYTWNGVSVRPRTSSYHIPLEKT